MKLYRNIQLITIILAASLPRGVYAQSSVLSAGNWFKLAIEKEGVYKINYNLLKKMGADPGKIDPRKIRIFGNHGGMLPQANSSGRPADLQENAILVSGEGDGRFDKQDFILFYATGPDKISFDSNRDIFSHENNLYSVRNFYFLTIAPDPGKRINATEDLGMNAPVIREFNGYFIHEEDQYNELHSGREWFGEKFGISTNEHTFSFPMEGIVNGSELKVVSGVLGQSHSNAAFLVSFNNTVIAEQNIPPIPNTRYGVKGVHKLDTIIVTADGVGAASRSTQEIKYQFEKGTGFSQGYLDFFLVSTMRKLALYNNQTIFLSAESVSNPISMFEIGSVNDQCQVWDITDPFNVRSQNFSLSNGAATFSTATDLLKRFIIFNTTVEAPVFEGKIVNQDLHALSAPNLVIVTHPSFRSEADRLALHRNSFSNWSTVVVTPDEIFHEFSSGRQDVSAIRDFLKFLNDKNPSTLKAVLLLGKCSYDYKDRVPNNTNFVTTYESRNSLHPLQTFSSDDYFGFLENSEGNWSESPPQNHTLDIGVGRLPVTDLDEARHVVDKIIAYDTNQKGFGYWRKQIVFAADDGNGEDGFTSLHQYQADQLSRYVEQLNAGMDTKKLFMGSYAKVVRPGGDLAPDFTSDIVRAFDRGSLIINYTGHGSEKQWADENVFNLQTIADLENKFYPFLVTATCEFGRHDSPTEVSGAERLVTIENAGVIGLVTTARPVNATTNFNLNQAFYEAFFQQEAGSYLSIGEVFRRTKNNSMSGVSNRNFSLLADPSMTLALPRHEISITSLKTKAGSDTLKALSTVIAKGEIRNSNNDKITSFNGILEATLFDKETTFVTIGKNSPPFSYQQWHNALFRGKAKVVEGAFEFEFTIPKNIAYQVEAGKFSLYAADPVAHDDASGSFNGFKVGESEINVIADNTPPAIRLYMGDTTFVNGGITAPNTYLVVNLTDASGLNISGYGIGNSMIAVLDDDEEAFVLNDYYVADANDYTSGWIYYPMKGLASGKHTITVKAWDVFNNPIQAAVDFMVTNGEGIVVESFANYPNPFAGSTKLFFTHNRSGDDLQAQVFIHKLTGELVKSGEIMIPASGYQVNLMELNTIGDFDKKLSAGLYLARLIVRSLTNGSKNEHVTKLIVLN